MVYCSGKQGAAFYHHNYANTLSDVEIYAPSVDSQNPPKWGLGEKPEPGKKILLFQSTPIRVDSENILRNPNGFSTWLVYTTSGLPGSSPSYRGAHGKLNSASFCFTNYLNSTQSRRCRFHICGSPGTIATLTGYHYLSHLVFSHGDRPVTVNQVTVTSAEGFIAYRATSESQVDWSVHCGCEHGNCQQGTFPLKYCCYSCSDVNRWLRQIRDDAIYEKREIQRKLGLPLT